MYVGAVCVFNIEAWIRVYIPFDLRDRVRVWCVLRDVSLNFILNYFVLHLQNAWQEHVYCVVC